MSALSTFHLRRMTNRWSSVQGINRHQKKSLLGPAELGHKLIETFIGKVVSTKSARTVQVEVASFCLHPRLRKYVKRTSRFPTHDQLEEANYGDVVEIRTCRPISKTKHHLLHRIIKPRHPINLADKTVPQTLTYRSILAKQQQAELQAKRQAEADNESEPVPVEQLSNHDVDVHKPLPVTLSLDMIETPLPLVRRRGALADAQAEREIEAEMRAMQQHMEELHIDRVERAEEKAHQRQLKNLQLKYNANVMEKAKTT